MPEHVRQQRPVRVLYGGPLALHDVYVRPAQPGGAHPDDDVQGSFDPRLVYLFYLEAVLRDALVVAVQPGRLHAVFSSLSGMP